MVRGRQTGAGAIQLDDGTLQCKKCGRMLARLDDGVMTVGNVQIWNEARYSCAACGKVYFYAERVANRRPKDEAVSLQTLHELASDAKHIRRKAS